MGTTFKTGTGFSIELINWRLEHRGEHMGLPLYESLGGEIIAVALVEEPAIGVGGIVDPTNKTITGPVMIPNLKIFRTQGLNGAENCYWYFSEATILTLQGTFKGNVKIGH
jgi:hypothetical protein